MAKVAHNGSMVINRSPICRRYYCLVALFAIAILAAESGPVEAAAAAPTIRAKVVRIVDGDTLVVEIASEKTTVRIWGIDAPERGQDLAGEATAALAELLAIGDEVVLETHGHDRYRRLVARVTNDSAVDVGERLVCNGLATWMRRYAPRYAAVTACEASARERQVGVWAAAR